jgi:hypothetical protein
MADTRYQAGSLKKINTKQGLVWKLRYFAHRDPDGKWSEQTPLLVGAVSDFPTEKRARAEAVRLGLIEQINRTSVPLNKVTFGFIARDYIRISLSDEAIKPKDATGWKHAGPQLPVSGCRQGWRSYNHQHQGDENEKEEREKGSG